MRNKEIRKEVVVIVVLFLLLLLVGGGGGSNHGNYTCFFLPPPAVKHLLTCDLSASSSAPDGGTKQRRQGQDVDQISAAFPNSSKPRRFCDGTEVAGVLELYDFFAFQFGKPPCITISNACSAYPWLSHSFVLDY